MRRQGRISQGTAVSSALVAVALVVGAAAGAGAAQFSEARLFFELNHTDGDLGIHASIDGGPYVRLEIEDPFERTILTVTADGRLAKQGLTQLFLESAEPSFDELAPADFFRRFPEGMYEIVATTHTGTELEARVRLSHVLAGPPPNVRVAGVPAAENCDAVLPEVSPPVIIEWDPVTSSHPIGKSGSLQIALYQLFVEKGSIKFGVDLPRTVTSFAVPPEIAALGGEFKFEIIARTTGGNNTAIESCFVVK